MKKTIQTTRTALLAATVAAALLGFPQYSFAAPSGSGAAPQAQGDNPAAGDAASRLNKKEFRNVKVTVDANGIATLSGTVDLFEFKADADKRVHKARGVTAVRNDIEVAGPTVPDNALKSKLVEKLTYDRVGYGNVFDAISVDVQNGVVTLAGHALDYPSKDSALGLVSTFPGVKEVVDNIQVDPASPMDNGIRANGVSGVFSVTNNLQVANQPTEGQRSSNN